MLLWLSLVAFCALAPTSSATSTLAAASNALASELVSFACCWLLIHRINVLILSFTALFGRDAPTTALPFADDVIGVSVGSDTLCWLSSNGKVGCGGGIEDT